MASMGRYILKSIPGMALFLVLISMAFQSSAQVSQPGEETKLINENVEKPKEELLHVQADVQEQAQEGIESLEPSVQTARMTMVVENIKSDVGSLYVSVFDSKKTFLSDDVVMKKTVEVAPALVDGKITIEIDIPYGEYAVSIHHDDNDNKEMDSNFMGIPKEPVALSNGHIPRFGPPRYRKAKFAIKEESLSQIFKLN